MGASIAGLSAAPSTAGAKATNLRWLLEHGYRVPPGSVITFDGAPTDAALADLLRDAVRPGTAYAVRSSASVEDDEGSSFAGQFASVLDAAGLDDVVAAVHQVLDSGRDERLLPYLEHAGVDAADVRMAVILQEMVAARAAGVAFSRNPVTGLSEVVIESTAGEGQDLVSGTVAPDRWVRRWGQWTQRPERGDTPEAVMDELADVVLSIAEARSEPVDIEWAWDGTELYILQVRPMTSRSFAVYSNRISKEFLPGMIPPLVWSINVPVVNGAWLDLFRSLVGDIDLQPEDLARQFAYRAYFNMLAVGDIFETLGMPRDLLEVLMGLPGGEDRPQFRPGPEVARHLSRMGRAGWRLLRYDRELDRVIPRLQRRFAAIEDRDLAALSDQELLDIYTELAELVQQAAFANIVAPLLMSAYGKLLAARLEKSGIDPRAVDPAAGSAAMESYDPNRHLARLSAAADLLDEETRALIAAGRLELLDGGEAFLRQFGHLSDSGNDFSRVTWREDPAQLGPLLLQPAPPTAEQQNPALGGADRRLRDVAGKYRVARERASYTFTRGYGLFRPAALEAGRRLAERGAIPSAEDVFLLTRSEMAAALAAGEGAAGDAALAEAVATRRAEMDRWADVDMPEVIFGDEFEPAPPSHPDRALQGVAASRGIRTGTARVVAGLSDASRVEPGDVVVIPYSDVGWTPMLARSAAIVAESGGLLSHSSIVAREFGIPCVVSVPGAMRIPDGATIRVDGCTGAVQWDDAPSAEDPA